ncbi:toll/interleukin-1 receptor domain-containing protein [Lachnoanaerobaculum gingivalis]|uniref:toll/interleukin-1 receptor domain-containing protein n=1 Tax=Lachnoanaerobaculum gingivalis TaxID=2490855 RepID=UPI0024A6D3A8|nr:toll/interleukin-1 receptor domain-containing protein [Lachnoanaerobaculum gingivalis]WHE86434.1 TIR domain-containing protein [Lachnoanaerobaculum gingivalis]
MANIFLSHSSKDKERYVRLVAEKLEREFDEHSIHYDEHTFEAGMKSLEEIEKCLNKTDLFVIFLSRASLNSDWVQKELFVGRESNIIKRIYPIVIEEDLGWNDKEIPEWLKEYNLKYISKPSKAVQLIRKRLIEITWDQTPEIGCKDAIFVGRNAQVQYFEERKYDYDKETVVAYFASGIVQIGRKSFLKHCFVKANILDRQTCPSIIEVGMYDGIEDLIVYLRDLGFSDEIDISNFMKQSLEEKTEALSRILDSISDNKEVIMIEDKGCIVTHEGTVCEWFIEALKKMQKKTRTVLGVASKFNIKLPVACDEMYVIKISPMDKIESAGLLEKYLDQKNVDLKAEDFKNYVNLMNGFPAQVKFTVSLLEQYGAEKTYDYSSEIKNYDSEIIIQLMRPYEDNEEYKEFIMLLVELDMVTYRTIQSIVKDDYFVSNIINKLYVDGIVEFYGVNREYIKIAYAVREYIRRADYELAEKYQKAINDYITKFLDKYEYAELDMPDYLFKIKEQVKHGKYNSEYMLPSQYLKTMVELYEKDRDYARVIEFADTILKGCEYIEEKLVFEIRFFLCMALAQKRDRRFLAEVQEIDGADHKFLLGFYYRRVGQYQKALEEIEQSLNLRKNFSKAKREKVQLLINLEQYDDAIELARQNYTNDKKNVYHAHAYLLCILHSRRNADSRDVIDEILLSISKSLTDLGKELYFRCKALVSMYYERDIDMALSLIDKVIEETYYKIYAIQDRFDICEKARDISEMKKTIEILESTDMPDSYGKERAMRRFRILLAAYKGEEETALSLIKDPENNKIRLNSDVLLKKVNTILKN